MTAREHHVVIVGYPGVELLDIAGPASVFTAATRLANHLARAPGYRVVVAGTPARSIPTANAVRLDSDAALDAVASIDTLVVPGSLAAALAPPDPELVAGVRAAAARAQRVAAVCTGAFVLAAAGLLDGKRATTHWAACSQLRAKHPRCRVEPDAIYVRDGAMWTSAGVTTGIDLALALVEQDHGRELALTVARWLVVYLQRPGGQSQFSAPLAAQRAEREPLRDVIAWMREHPSGDLDVPSLAKRAGMSERNFARVFRRELGVTPAAHVEALRLEAARRALETTTAPTKRIAASCGFGTVETMHRVFQRVLHVTPGDYRRRFKTAKR
jgi:transcriptional regulator GlxA family with amidase domain